MAVVKFAVPDSLPSGFGASPSQTSPLLAYLQVGDSKASTVVCTEHIRDRVLLIAKKFLPLHSFSNSTLLFFFFFLFLSFPPSIDKMSCTPRAKTEDTDDLWANLDRPSQALL